MKKIAIISILCVIAVGCFSPAAKHYYQLHLTESTDSLSDAAEQSLLFEPVFIRDLYNDFRIIYRVSPYELKYYSYEFWADKPQKLIRESVRHFLLREGLFTRIFNQATEGEADAVLRIRVEALEEVDGIDHWKARLALTMELSDPNDGRVLVRHVFDRAERLSEKKVGLVPIVVSRILEEELQTFARLILKSRS